MNQELRIENKILEINNLTKNRINKEYLEEVAEATLKIGRANKKIKISLVFVGEKLSQKLNYIYRDKNRPTDVLSFLYEDNEGEIVICYPVAIKQALRIGGQALRIGGQAKIYQTTIKAELTRLLIHGILHLVGYNHESFDDAEQMENREREIIKLSHNTKIRNFTKVRN